MIVSFLRPSLWRGTPFLSISPPRAWLFFTRPSFVCFRYFFFFVAPSFSPSRSHKETHPSLYRIYDGGKTLPENIWDDMRCCHGLCDAGACWLPIISYIFIQQ